MPYTILSLLIHSSSTFAVIPCAPRNAVVDALSPINQYVIPVVQVDDPDRKLVDEYAAAKKTTAPVVEKAYAATGDLSCPYGDSQANLTLVGDVITTAAHTVTNGKCVSPTSTKGCKVTFEIAGEKQTYELDKLIDSGRNCGTTQQSNKGTDWAIIRLKKKVDPRIKPYRIAPEFFDTLVDNTPITVVAKSVDFPKSSGFKKLADRPRHYADCMDRTAASSDFSTDLRTDCDLDHGGSGGGVFTRESSVPTNQAPTLIGVASGGNTGGGKNCPASTKTQKSGSFSEECYNTVMTLVSGDFKDALVKIQSEERASETLRQTAPNQSPKYDDL